MSTQNTAWIAHADQRTDAIVEKLIKERDAMKAYAERLEQAGEAIVADGLNIATLTRWHKALEGKP